MTPRRFLAWLIEKLVEVHLAIAGLIAVKMLLPLTPGSYASPAAFLSGVAETLRAGADEASFVTHTLLNGSWGAWLGQTYLAAAWTIGLYIYLRALYAFTSLFAALVSGRHYVRNQVLAFLFSFAVFCGLYRADRDATSVSLAACLLVGGLAVVIVSALIGKRLAGVTAKPAPKRPVAPRRIDFSAEPREPVIVDAMTAPMAAPRGRCYFRD